MSPWIWHLFYATSSFVHHFIPISEIKLGLQSGNAQFGSKSAICFVPCDREIWQTTLESNRAILLCTSSFVPHFVAICEFKLELWSGNAQIGTKFAFSSVTLTFDLRPWPFVWASLLSMVITPENVRMIRWEKRCQKSVTDGRTNGQTDGQAEINVLRAAWSQLINTLKHCYILLVVTREIVRLLRLANLRNECKRHCNNSWLKTLQNWC